MPRLASNFLVSLGLGVTALFAPNTLLAQTEAEEPPTTPEPVPQTELQIEPGGPPPGQTVYINEGWYRVEPEGTPEEGFVGTLEVGRLETGTTGETTEPPTPEKQRPGPQLELREPSACRDARARYTEELFRMAGIWDAPWALDLVEALGSSGPGLSPWIRFNLFGQVTGGTLLAFPPGVDPFRPLAWDQEIRHAAKELAFCHQALAQRQRM